MFQSRGETSAQIDDRVTAQQPYLAVSLPDGSPWCEYYRSTDGYLLRYPGIADFWLDPEGRLIRRMPHAGADQATVEHIHLNQVLPLSWSHGGELVLHASSVAIDGRCVAFVGETGRGKSTLAAAFATRGFRFLTDDGLIVRECDDGYVAVPSHPSIRLWQDSTDRLLGTYEDRAASVSYTTKSRLLAGPRLPHCDAAMPLASVFFLGDRNVDAVGIRALSRSETAIALLKHVFVLDTEDRARLTRQFARVTALAERVACYEIEYPRRYETVEDVVAGIREHISRDERGTHDA